MQRFPGAMLNCVSYHGVSVVIFFKTMYSEAIIRFGFRDIPNNQGIDDMTLNSALNIT